MAGRAKDMTGQVIGRLTVLKKAFTKNETVYWNCKCSCGIDKIIAGSSLRRKNRKSMSCGCLQREFVSNMHRFADNIKYTHNELRLQILKHHFQNSAKGREIEFELTILEISDLTNKNCYYCNSPPSNTLSPKNYRISKITYQGIDRIDSNKGYISSNVRPCCKICNIAKSTLTDNDFKQHIYKIFYHLKGKL